jgi:hypothetical protein
VIMTRQSILPRLGSQIYVFSQRTLYEKREGLAKSHSSQGRLDTIASCHWPNKDGARGLVRTRGDFLGALGWGLWHDVAKDPRLRWWSLHARER